LTNDGEVVAPVKYDELFQFSEGRARVRLGSRWGFIDVTGIEVIPPQYDSVTPFDRGVSIVELNGKVMAIDLDGSCIQHCD
jgi:hypothetical protein